MLMAIYYVCCAVVVWDIGKALESHIDAKHAAFRERNKELLK